MTLHLTFFTMHEFSKQIQQVIKIENLGERYLLDRDREDFLPYIFDVDFYTSEVPLLVGISKENKKIDLHIDVLVVL